LPKRAQLAVLRTRYALGTLVVAVFLWLTGYYMETGTLP